ncbi:MAG: hypothetical protein FJY11_05145, partial [Bacteroidetes bacterium]|nr:hypothetical protein [Bacteroidota bacterium]
MKYRLLISLHLIIFTAFAKGQLPQGSWADNLSYNNGRFVVMAGDIVYCATPSGIIAASTSYSSVSKLSTVTGLSSTNLSTIGWSAETSTLIVAYSTTNIDLLKGNQIRNLPEIMRKNIPGLKEIYRVRTLGSRAYLACSFGIVVIDLAREEIFDTWKPGPATEANAVYDIAFSNGNIFAATARGIFQADITNPGLAYFGNWNRQDELPSPGSAYSCIAAAGGNIFANRLSATAAGDSVFMYNGNWQYLYSTPGTRNHSFEVSATAELIVSSELDVKYFRNDGTLLGTVTGYGTESALPSNAIRSGQTFWIADRNQGLVSVTPPAAGEFYLPDGPAYNSVANIHASNGTVYVAGGAVDNAWNNTWKMLEASWRDQQGWHSLPPSAFRDAVRIIPGKSNNYFISTWGMGLLEYSGNTLLNHYNESNSPLNSVIPGQPFTRLCGMAFDPDDNLWIVHSGVTQNIKVLKPDRTWISLPVTIDAPTISDIIITRNGHKWIVLPRGYGLFIIDDNGTPEQFDDDTYRKMIIRDTDDKVISNVYSVTEDLDGNIWVGTDQGPAIYYNPVRPATEDIRAVRIKIPRNDGTGLADYMLGTEIITSIAVDGANRKWISTLNSGVFLLSADGTKKIAHFTAENSPLPSNTVVSVATDVSNGMVWFGTASGIIAYRGDAPAGREKLKGVYPYPNPVRPDY